MLLGPPDKSHCFKSRQSQYVIATGIDDNDTITRTQAASQFTTDWWFDVGAHYEASHHSSYVDFFQLILLLVKVLSKLV